MRDFFPISAKVYDVKSLFISIIIYIAASIAVGIVIDMLLWLPLVGRLLGFASELFSFYCLGGILVSIMLFFKLV